ncbi:chalcone-flavanone isomerase-domain-containing protein [Aspergillus californicus]
MAMKRPLSMQGSLPFRTCGQCIRHRYLCPTRTPRYLSTSSPLRSATPSNPLRSSGNARSREQEIAKSRRSMLISAAGIAASAVAMYGVIKLDVFGLEQQNKDGGSDKDSVKDTDGNNSKAMKMDGPQGFTPSASVIRIQGQDGAEQVSTGTSSVPHFPSTIRLPKYQDTAKSGDNIGPATGAEEEEEYQLLGLGIRTVSFLRIQVYVVGMYVAKSDISELQRRLVQTAVNPPSEQSVIANKVGATSATSLVSTERSKLKDLLLDEEKGDDAWNAIIRQDGLKTAFRIVPTRNTDFMHLRDAFIRGISGRAQRENAKVRAATQAGNARPEEFQDEAFGNAVAEFKTLISGGQGKNILKGQSLLLVRTTRGELDALFQTSATESFRFMGRVSDERISRLVWLNYLAGKNVSSEPARRSVVDGVMGIVERPVGTLVTKVL